MFRRRRWLSAHFRTHRGTEVPFLVGLPATRTIVHSPLPKAIGDDISIPSIREKWKMGQDFEPLNAELPT
jgi:hypothetical protein